MKTGPRGLALIKSFESLRLTAYRDVGGVLTIGYGHTGPDVKEGDTITEHQAEVLLATDLLGAERAVEDRLNREPRQSEFDSMVSLTFNIGVNAFKGSTLANLADGDHRTAAARQFPLWCKDNGQEVRGLLRRRFAEAALFLED